MARRIPNIKQGKKICIICEGYEEFDYLARLLELEVWSSRYQFILINAKSNGSIPARYQSKYQSDSYDCVMVFCDTDMKPYGDYRMIKEKINHFHGSEKAADEVVMYGNPCTMQVMILHWDYVLLKSHRKEINGEELERLLGIQDYKAKRFQRDDIVEHITRSNYYEMVARCSRLPDDDTHINSTNFDRFMHYFESNNPSWIQKIEEAL